MLVIIGVSVFVFCTLGLLHTYLLYPQLLRWLSLGRQPNRQVFRAGDAWPLVSVVMSVYNEERVIEQKMRSLLELHYPAGKIHFFIGSDCSQDRTNPLLQATADRHAHVHFYPFEKRRGKPGVVNELVARALELHPADAKHVLLITDANVMLSPGALTHLVKHFRNPRIALVDAHMVHTGMQTEGISRAENQYISGEVMLKHREGIRWGKMIGPFGGCYALRSTHFCEVPPTFLVDDFFIAMKVFEGGGDAINDLDARCYEAVSHDIREEYRRKSRISAGNFQNLIRFRHLWWPPTTPLGFAFFSHKVLRWLGPFLMIGMLAGAVILAVGGNMYFLILFSIMILAILGLPLLDRFLKSVGIHWLLLRGINYFLFMNLALLEGFFKCVKGIRSNVWEPPKRN